MPSVRQCQRVIRQFLHDCVGDGRGIGSTREHARYEPIANHVFRPLNRLFALADKGRMVFRDDGLPHGHTSWVFGDFYNGSLEFLDNAMRGYAPKLRIDWPEARMRAHNDLVARTRKHGAGRHCELWNEGANVRSKH